MERGYKMPTLFDENGVAPVFRKHVYVRSGAANNWRAYEDSLNIALTGALLKIFTWRNVSNTAIELTAVGIALDGEIHGSEALLLWVRYFLREQNRARAGAEDRLRFYELGEGFQQIHHVQEFEHRGTFAAWDDEPVDIVQLFGGADFDCVAARVFDGSGVRVEVALESEDSDAFFIAVAGRHGYHPRVCMSSPSGSLAISSPGMAMPRSWLAWRSFFGSL